MKSTFTKLVFGFLVGIVLLGLTAAPAQANSITLSLLSKTPSGSNFTYVWDVSVGTLDSLHSGAVGDWANATYFTIYDIATVINGSTTLAGGFGTWNPTTALVGVTPGSVSVNDDATIGNWTFQYLGPTQNFATAQSIGTITITSTQDMFDVAWTSRDYKQNGTVDEAVHNVPEPMSLLLLGSGLLGLAGIARRKK